MERISSTTDRAVRIPRIVWFLGGSLLVALAAIFVFNVPAQVVLYYGFLILCIGGHFLMHGSHSGHAGHGQNTATSAKSDDSAVTTQAKDKHE